MRLSAPDDVEGGGPAVGVDEEPAQREGHHIANPRAEEAPGNETVEDRLTLLY